MPNDRERNELLDATCDAIGPGANPIELLRELVERRPDGMTAKGIRLWKGLHAEDSWPQREASRLRKRLKRFRQKQGQFLDWCFELRGTEENEGLYKIVMRRNIPPQSPEGFWWPHFWMQHENRIVITEPVFFRHLSDRYYVRHFEVNEPDAALLVKKLDGLGSDPTAFLPVHHYVSIGEVYARDTLGDGLRELNEDVPLSFWTSCEITFTSLLRGHMILTGTSRASSAIQEFQQTEDRLIYEHSDTGVVRRDDSGRHIDSAGQAYYGIVSRIADRSAKTAKTVIACNHGPATRLIADYLFSDAIAPQLTRALKLKGPWEGFPDRFQILFRVTLTKESENFGNAELVLAEDITHR